MAPAPPPPVCGAHGHVARYKSAVAALSASFVKMLLLILLPVVGERPQFCMKGEDFAPIVRNKPTAVVVVVFTSFGSTLFMWHFIHGGLQLLP